MVYSVIMSTMNRITSEQGVESRTTSVQYTGCMFRTVAQLVPLHNRMPVT